MLIEERRIEVSQLRTGMFVCRLDREWEGTPFLLQGFLVQDQDDIDQLTGCCRHVFIDVEKGHDADVPLQAGDRGAAVPAQTLRPDGGDSARGMAAELANAAVAVERIAADAVAIIDALRAGESVGHERITSAVEPVVSSLVRNADAFFWLQALRRQGSYAYAHAVDSCALSVALGRQLGLPDPVLRELAVGGLLLDIGMSTVAPDILERRSPLDVAEWTLVRAHTRAGSAMYVDGDGDGKASAIARSMILHHHERHDGSGYPDGLAGDDLPVWARIAGLVDSYDAMTSDRPYRAAMSRHDALQAIYRDRDRLYQHALVEQFMQCLGVYPVGSLVEMNSGEVAVVMAQNPTRRLRPVLMLLTDAAKALRSYFQPLDLMYVDRAGLPEAALHIVRGLPPGAYGLEPSELYL